MNQACLWDKEMEPQPQTCKNSIQCTDVTNSEDHQSVEVLLNTKAKRFIFFNLKNKKNTLIWFIIICTLTVFNKYDMFFIYKLKLNA